jgi:hypothetical protein
MSKIKSITTETGETFQSELWDLKLQKDGYVKAKIKSGNYNIFWFPKTTLKIKYEPEKYAVHTPTKADCNELMRLYEIAGWRCADSSLASKNSGLWFFSNKETAVIFKNNFKYSGVGSCKLKSYTILNLAEARQKLSEMFPEKDFSEKSKQIFFDNGACVLPLKGEEYWFTDDWGDVRKSKWDGYPFDFCRLQSQNVFLTKEAAENTKDVRDTHNRILAKVKKIDAENGWAADWNNFEQLKWFVNWSFFEKRKISGNTSGIMKSLIVMSKQAKDYLMSDKVSDEDFKKFCLIY